MRSWLLSTILALAPTPGPSRVELDVSGLEQHMHDEALHRFHGELLLRLLEAGHGVGDDGSVVLSLTSAGDTIVVECSVDGRRERIEVDHADAAVLGLELIHRAVDLVERCTATAAGSGDGMIIDTDGSIETSELIVELVDMPITLIADQRHAAWRLCVRERGAFVTAIELPCDAAASVTAADPREAIERWRAPAEPAPEPPGPEPEPEFVEPPPDSLAAPPNRARAWGLSVGVAGGVQLGFPIIAASVGADLAALHRSGVFVGALGSIAPSRAEQLAVIDGLGLATVGWRARVSDRVVLRPSLGLGVAIHRFVYANEPVDHRLELAVRVPFELELRLAGHVHATVAVAGTVGTRRIEHLLGTTPLWTRGVFRLDALIGLRFDWLPNA